jgi:hypothetical protein
MPSKLHLTAYHEAGHAVMAHLRLPTLAEMRAEEKSFRPLHRASVVPIDDALGHIARMPLSESVTPQSDPTLRAEAIADIEVFLAGPLAEARRLTFLREGHTGTAEHVMARFEETAIGQDDLPEATKLARSVSLTDDDARQLMYDLARRCARRFVKRTRVWNAVGTLAAALVAQGELDGCVAHWVIRRALGGSHYVQLEEELRRRVARRHWPIWPLSKKAERLGR